MSDQKISTFHELLDGGDLDGCAFEQLCEGFEEWLTNEESVVDRRIVWNGSHDRIRGSLWANFSAYVKNYVYEDWFLFAQGYGIDEIRSELERHYHNNEEFRDSIDRNTHVVNDRNAIEGTYHELINEKEEEAEEDENMSEYGKLHDAGIVDEDMNVDESKLRGAASKFIRDIDELKGTEEEFNRDDLRAAFNRWMLDRVGDDWARFVSDKLDPGDLMDVVLYAYKYDDGFEEIAKDKFHYDPGELEGNSPLDERRRRKKKQNLANYDQDEVNEGRIDNGEEEVEPDVRDEESGGGSDSDDSDPEFDVKVNEVYNASCVDVADCMDSSSLDALITDPPYGQNYDSRGEEHDVIEADDNLEDALGITEEIAKKCRMKLKKGSPVIMFAGDSNLCGVKRIVDKWFEYKQTIIWDKDWIGTSSMAENPMRFRKKHEYIVIGSYGSTDVENENRHDGSILTFRRPSGDNRVHPTEKPLDLMRYILESFTDKGDVVFDPFAGSGATLVAANQNDREYIGTELDEKFYEAINDRLSQNTISDWA